jgi:uncharacterized protein with HEPN domain
MSSRDDGVLVRDILDACAKAERIVSGRGRADLDTDDVLSLALQHLTQIAGEAAAHLSDGFKAGHSQVPWVQMVGMRNRLVHGYFSIDHDVLWKTVSVELPELLALLRTFA